MISIRFQSNPFNITVIQLYAPTMDVEQAEVDNFYEDLEDLLELIAKQTNKQTNKQKTSYSS